MFRLANDEALDIETLRGFIANHQSAITRRYKVLKDAYETRYPIFTQAPKPDFKPDKRIAVNFAKYIVDTMNGFFIGTPIKVMCDEDENVANYVEYLDAYNDQDDNNAELSKLCDIYGKGYEMYYVDENGNIGITYLSPIDAFMIYDDSILERPRYFVRLYMDADDNMYGSASDRERVQYFSFEGGLHWIAEQETLHGFKDVPATEFRENEEEIGLFEPVLSMINEYNEAISEKANDVAYFADAYLKILGAKLGDEVLQSIRDNRIINFEGTGVSDLIVEFLQKPNGDTTQENLLNRLERLIFQISMVANISDENFGSSSGIALKYKLQAMSDLALTKQRKFTSGMNRRYKVIFSNPVSGMRADDWVKLKYIFTQNMPANLLEEAQIAAQLTGIVSQPTQLSVLSIVDNVQQEIQQIDEEQDSEGYMTDYPTNRTVEEENATDTTGGAIETEVQGKALNGAQTQSLIAIMSQYSAGELTEGQAVNLISTAIGLSKDEARGILNGDM